MVIDVHNDAESSAGVKSVLSLLELCGEQGNKGERAGLTSYPSETGCPDQDCHLFLETLMGLVACESIILNLGVVSTSYEVDIKFLFL